MKKSEIKDEIRCPSCESDRLTKFGKSKASIQRYKCQECDRVFTGNVSGRPAKHKDISVNIPVPCWQKLRVIALNKRTTPTKYLETLIEDL